MRLLFPDKTKETFPFYSHWKRLRDYREQLSERLCLVKRVEREQTTDMFDDRESGFYGFVRTDTAPVVT